VGRGGVEGVKVTTATAKKGGIKMKKWTVEEGFKSITIVPDTDLPRYMFLPYVNHDSFERELERIRNKGVI
jgi:hypothetical protein